MSRRLMSALVGACAPLAAFGIAALACRPASSPPDAAGLAEPAASAASSVSTGGNVFEAGGPPADGPPTVTSGPMRGGADDADDAATPPPKASDPMDLHASTRDELLALFSVKELPEPQKKVVQADRFLRAVIGPDGPSHMNQGNRALARHTISKEACLAGLKDIVVQTPEQRQTCGEDNMVPVWLKGKPPWFCIDVFEFPNKPCELPLVWTAPTHAKRVCELQGKRLCSDIEWNAACRGDPAGGPDQRYAYGERLDLDVCHTNLVHRTACSAHDAKTAWNTCATDTEPSGAFPKCRSRFGVFDQHGNVAEVMMRREGEKVVTQLKGSAWFYVELAKEPGEKVPEATTNKAGAYPDHCNFDPRWHVEDYSAGAWHVNYHLGFRCCKSIP